MALIAHYKLDGNANDSVGGNHGTATNVTWVDGKLGKAGSFNGTSSVVSCGDMFNLGINNMSFSFWFRVNSITGSNQNLITKTRAAGQTERYGFSVNSSGNFTVLIANTVNTSHVDYIGSPITPNTWYHAVVILNKIEPSKIYLNGTLDLEFSPASFSSDFISNNPFKIGAYTASDNISSTSLFGGLIDDVRIYDHALSLKEVQELAKAKVLHYTFDSQDDDANNVVRDCSGQDNDAVLVPSTKPTWTSASRLGAGAYSFDGVDDFIKYTPQIISSANELTVAGWIYPVAGGSNYRCALHHGDGTSVGSTRYWFGISGGNKLTATIGASSGVGWTAGETTTTVTYNQWVHLAASWDGATVRVFINGVFNKSYTLTTYQAINTPTRIGASSDGDNYQYAGNVDDVRIYATALTDAQVLELYQTRASLDDTGNFYA
jgi:hypothetical protein